MSQRFRAIYRVRADALRIEARANEIAIEQSVEMPLAAIDDAFVRADIVGRVETIEAVGAGLFDVRIALATATVGGDPGQLLNMLFGNTSLQDDTTLQDVELPAELVALFGGPRHGVAGLRARVQAGRRALTCAALKPQGLSPVELAALARRFAQGGIDCIKDDHGIADQAYSPFAARVEAVAAAVREVAEAEGRPIVYAPSLSGDLDRLRAQVAQARSAGLTAVLVAPLIVGLSNFHRLVAENPDIAFLAHPSMGGAAGIAPALLFGKLFRLFGADAFIFPHHGGRFGYSAQTCRDLADAGRFDWQGLRPSLPVPAGGMNRDRASEMLDFYGAETMLLIGGALLAAGERLVEETAAFVAAVRNHPYSERS